MRYRIASISGLALLTCGALFADFQYEQTTRITGGFIASMGRLAPKSVTEPQTSTVLLKGNRMAHISARSASIVDLDKETITNVDFDKKTYSVMTFQQMRQAMEEGLNELEKNKAGANDADLRFNASVKETGNSKTVSGLPAKEFVLTMTMAATDAKSGQSGAMHITNDMWMASDVPGYDEVRRFYLRMAEKMGTTFTGLNPAAAFGRPGIGKGLAEMAKEMAKLKGVPVMQVTRMGSTADGKPLPSATEAPELSKQSQMQMPTAGEVGQKAATGAAESAAGAAAGRIGRLGGIAGGMGGLGGFGRKKQQDQQPKEERPQQQPGAGAGLLMETTMESGNFSSASVDGSKLEVPAGFKQVESEMMKRRGR